MLEEARRSISMRKKRARSPTSFGTSSSPKKASTVSLETLEAGSSSRAPERPSEVDAAAMPPLATMLPVKEAPTVDVPKTLVVAMNVLVLDVLAANPPIEDISVADTLEATVATTVVPTAETPSTEMLVMIIELISMSLEAASTAEKLPEEVVEEATPVAPLSELVIVVDPLSNPLQEMGSDRGSDNIPPPLLPQILILTPLLNPS